MKTFNSEVEVQPMPAAVETGVPREVVVEFKEVSKSFGSNRANDAVSFSIQKNEVHALLGENGAGKSTIMSILFGLYARDSGDVIVKGNLVNYRSAKDANADGIAMLPQHFKLIENMSVLENVILGKEKHKAFVLDTKSAKRRLTEIMEQYNLPLDPDAMVDTLSVSEKQRVELLKILWTNAEIMILDEPTSILTPNEIENFLGLVADFKKQGKTVIIITHKLDEVKRIADRCTIMRRGAVVASHHVAGLTESEMAHMMVGRSVDLQLSSIPRERTPMDRIALGVENLFLKQRVSQKALNGIALDIRAGEILGIAAVEGNGQSELFKVVGGMLAPDAGEVFINEQQVTDWSIKRRYSSQRLPLDEIVSLKAQIAELRTTLKAVEKEEAATGEIYTKAGGPRSSAIRRQINHFKLLAKRKRAFLAHIPEDRHEHGLILDFSCADNAVLQDIDNYGRFGFYIRSDAIAKLDFLIRNYDIRGVESANTPVRALSGGNQQKLILGREIERQASVLLAYNPTRGLDVGSIRRVYEQIMKQRDNGAAVLFYSGELEEVLDVSDRVAIMHNGIFVGVYQARDINRDEAGLAMFTGVAPEFTTSRGPVRYIGDKSVETITSETLIQTNYLPHDAMEFVHPVPSFYPLLPEYVIDPLLTNHNKVETLVAHKAEVAKEEAGETMPVLRPRTYVAKKRRKRKTVKKSVAKPVKVVAVPVRKRRKARAIAKPAVPVVVRPRARAIAKPAVPVVVRPRARVELKKPIARAASRKPNGSVHKTTVVRTIKTTVVKTVSKQKSAIPVIKKNSLSEKNITARPVKKPVRPKVSNSSPKNKVLRTRSKARGR